VLGLEWLRVDFQAATLILDAQDTKSGKPRAFPFGALPELAELLRAQRITTGNAPRGCAASPGEPLASRLSPCPTPTPITAAVV